MASFTERERERERERGALGYHDAKWKMKVARGCHDAKWRRELYVGWRNAKRWRESCVRVSRYTDERRAEKKDGKIKEQGKKSNKQTTQKIRNKKEQQMTYP
jgi:hypothetical protein